MKTTVAQRAGIVASVAWLLVGFSWSFNDETNRATNFAANIPHICEQQRDRDRTEAWSKPDHCWDTYAKDFDVFGGHRVADGLFAGLAPIPFGWLIAFLIVRIGRWIRYGRWRRQKV